MRGIEGGGHNWNIRQEMMGGVLKGGGGTTETLDKEWCEGYETDYIRGFSKKWINDLAEKHT